MNEPIMYLAVVGALLVAFATTRISQTPAGLARIIGHFQNYAVIGLLGLVSARVMPPLEVAVEPKWSILLPGLAYFSAFALLGGLTLANYYFGMREIGQYLGPKSYGAAKAFAVRIAYTILLLSLRPVVFPH